MINTPKSHPDPINTERISTPESSFDKIKVKKAKAAYSKPSLRIIDEKELPLKTRIKFYSIKYIYINDAFSNYRMAFAEKALLGANINKYRLLFDILPRTFEKLDILIVAGNDFDRLSGFIKVNKPLLIHTPKIVLGNTLNPVKRAELLKLGYDEVLNIKNSHPDELLSKIFMIHDRYQIAQQQFKVIEDLSDSIGHICDFEKLTYSQKKILHCLIKAAGNFASYDQLSISASRTYKNLSRPHVRVLIYGIRPHLNAGYSIINVPGKGYRLENSDN